MWSKRASWGVRRGVSYVAHTPLPQGVSCMCDASQPRRADARPCPGRERAATPGRRDSRRAGAGRTRGVNEGLGVVPAQSP